MTMYNVNTNEVLKSMKALADFYEETHDDDCIPAYFESFARCHGMKFVPELELLNPELIPVDEACERFAEIVAEYYWDGDAEKYLNEFLEDFKIDGEPIPTSHFLQGVYNILFDFLREDDAYPEFDDFLENGGYKFMFVVEYAGEINTLTPALYNAIKDIEGLDFVGYKF